MLWCWRRRVHEPSSMEDGWPSISSSMRLAPGQEFRCDSAILAGACPQRRVQEVQAHRVQELSPEPVGEKVFGPARTLKTGLLFGDSSFTEDSESSSDDDCLNWDVYHVPAWNCAVHILLVDGKCVDSLSRKDVQSLTLDDLLCRLYRRPELLYRAHSLALAAGDEVFDAQHRQAANSTVAAWCASALGSKPQWNIICLRCRDGGRRGARLRRSWSEESVLGDFNDAPQDRQVGVRVLVDVELECWPVETNSLPRRFAAAACTRFFDDYQLRTEGRTGSEGAAS